MRLSSRGPAFERRCDVARKQPECLCGRLCVHSGIVQAHYEMALWVRAEGVDELLEVRGDILWASVGRRSADRVVVGWYDLERRSRHVGSGAPARVNSELVAD